MNLRTVTLKMDFPEDLADELESFCVKYNFRDFGLESPGRLVFYIQEESFAIQELNTQAYEGAEGNEWRELQWKVFAWLKRL